MPTMNEAWRKGNQIFETEEQKKKRLEQERRAKKAANPPKKPEKKKDKPMATGKFSESELNDDPRARAAVYRMRARSRKRK